MVDVDGPLGTLGDLFAAVGADLGDTICMETTERFDLPEWTRGR